jgi:RNA polymerase sigma-70 factor (ECF subfamily)
MLVVRATPPASVDDSPLVARALAGSSDAFETLVARHQRRVYALARRVLRDHDLADEATQRTFVRAFERLRTYRGEARFATWLHHIGMNECRDLLRAQRGRVDLDDVPAERLATTDDTQAPLGRRLRALVAELPPRQQSVLALRVFGELPFAEIARSEGITENAAKVSYHYAVRRLQAWLGRTPS